MITDIEELKKSFPGGEDGQSVAASEEEIQRFMRIAEDDNFEMKVLQAAYDTFSTYKKVRVRTGPLEGAEGYLVRIRRDRKFVMSLGELAIAVTGISLSVLDEIGE